MSNNCFKQQRPGGPGRENNKRLKLSGSGFPDIPPAPAFKTKIRGVDYDFQERKRRYKHLIPVYTLQQVQRLTLSYHELLMKTLLDSGYEAVVNELIAILKKEKDQGDSCELANVKSGSLISRPELFKRLAETLKFSQDLEDVEKPEQALTLRKELAVRMMQDQMSWLARHLLEISLVKAESTGDGVDQTKAECHCLLAYLSMDECELRESSVEENLYHLSICRKLSDNQQWTFRPEVITLRIKKPIYIHGFRDAEHVIDGSTMHVYNIATLLEYELLIKLVDQLLMKDIVTDNEVVLAAKFTDDALNLAIEVHDSEAMNAALVRFGNILHSMGYFEEAMDYFDELQLQAELKLDSETEALAFHGLGSCFNGKKEILNALEMFVIQQQKTEGIVDLEAEACQEVGMTLLAEGQTLEGKIGLWLSEQKFEEGKDKYKTPTVLLDEAWALTGISLGQDLWGRYSGLTRRRSVKDIRALIEFKNFRKPLPKVKRPSYKASFVDQGVTFGVSRASEGTLQTFRQYMTQEERRYDLVQRLAEAPKEKHEPKKVTKKSVLFSARHPSSSLSPDYDSFSLSGSSQSPASMFDADVPFASDANREDISSDDDYRSGQSNSSKSTTGTGSSKLKLLGSVIKAAKSFQSGRGTLGSNKSVQGPALSLGSMNRIQKNLIEKSTSLGVEDAKTTRASGSSLRLSVGTRNDSQLSKVSYASKSTVS